MYKICFYVPIDHAELVKNAMFKAGAGKIGDYSCCAWQVLGEGQFLPMEGSDPFIGEKFHIKKIEEYKVEMVCAENYINDVIAALHETHPYEEPAYQVTRVEDF
ncbi:MAG: NGG1p interacting factor NIF3 [Gammaproteobacteria bacterium]|nr:MAG: NGG1p interacting factor NIF3 [Gammaproteobacteria bacterium]